MTTDPRAALDRLVAALEQHLQASSERRDETDPAVVSAYQTLADAFERYDDALYSAHGEVTPLVLFDDAEDDAEDEDDDEDDLEDDEDDDLEDDEDDDDDEEDEEDEEFDEDDLDDDLLDDQVDVEEAAPAPSA
jgi:hypothetical protein